jgi:DNA-binding transcriptional regulator YiaG
MKWDRHNIRALRRHLGFNQRDFASEIGVRQQTVSEWEQGKYIPRGATAKILGITQEKSGFSYHAVPEAMTDAFGEKEDTSND